MALVTEPGKVHACLERLADGAATLARGEAAAGADAILISSAFAGAGFISPAHYREFVLPYEKKVIDAVRATFEIPVYTHTCGAIGDRLELMVASGTDGIDTLDPPPLGTIDLADARRRTAGRLFLKGNIDPVNTVLLGTSSDVLAAARDRIETAGPGGGYILSTACAVPPAAPPENVAALAEAAESLRPLSDDRGQVSGCPGGTCSAPSRSDAVYRAFLRQAPSAPRAGRLCRGLVQGLESSRRQIRGSARPVRRM